MVSLVFSRHLTDVFLFHMPLYTAPVYRRIALYPTISVRSSSFFHCFGGSTEEWTKNTGRKRVRLYTEAANNGNFAKRKSRSKKNG